MSNKVKEKGFSLLEMMIVTTIIGILVGVSMIIMQDYVVKARVSEGLVMISPIKNLVVENAYHGMPQLNTSFTPPTPTENVSDISLNDIGIITITFTARAGNGTIIFIPTDNVGQLTSGTPAVGAIKWDCRTGSLPTNYRPLPCR